MSRGETGSTGIGLNYRNTSSAFLKAGARLTILSVLSNKVKTQSAVLLNKEKPKLKIAELPSGEDTKPQSAHAMSMISEATGNKLASANNKDNRGIKMDKEGNNNNETKLVNGDICGIEEKAATAAKTGVIKCQSDSSTRNGPNTKHVKFSDKDKTPFHFMAERKLSEPVLSPRKRANAMTSRMTRCRSTADVRANASQKPVVRELGGYKYYQKPEEQVTGKPVQRTSSNMYRSAGAPNYVGEIATLRQTVADQKKTLSQRERHVLQLEKNISCLENENTKSKRQIDALRASVQDCSSTVDYLKREREGLVSEQDRLKFTLLTYEDELKQLRHTNSTLVTEYEHTEQSRLIAVGHLHELEEIEQNAHAPQNDQSVVPAVKLSEQLKRMKGCADELRRERTAIQDEHRQMVLLFHQSVQELSAKIVDASRKKARETTADATPEVSPDSREAEEQADGGDRQLIDFKDKLKANEKNIDALANEIRTLENKKKSLLESRFALIQNYQATQRVLGDQDMSELDENESMRDIESGTDEDGEGEEEVGEIPRSPTTSVRVTKKIRKLERTLSMDHGVGKMDCIQKLCKKLEDCEQKIAELETSNKDLREENDEMEEETKYLKYVLSYRGDTMKAQLEREYDKKVSDLREELRVAKETGGDVSQVHELRERNRGLEGEVQRLHEELKSLLSSLPGLQSGNEPSGGNTSQENNELVRDLKEQVEQLTAEKRVLLMSIQARNAEEEHEESECDQSMSKSLTLLEKTLREVENENAHFVETFKRIREVLEDDHVDDTVARESSKIAKLKGEIRRLDDTRGSIDNPAPREDTAGACVHHEERLSELGKEVVRLHEEKKSLLSTIIRLQADPNFTFSDDVTDDDISHSLLRSPGIDSDPSRVGNANSPKPLERECMDKGVQVGVDGVQGIVGYLEDGLGKLKEALGQQCMPGYIPTQSQEGKESSTELEELRRKLEEFKKENCVLQENLSESEAIRSDLHRTISIATEMAQDEREKCANLMQTKTALEQDMMKLTKDNQDLRDGMETLSRVRKRRNSRVQYMSLASPTSGGEYDGQPQLFLPLGEKRCTLSENDTSDMDVSTPEAKC